MISLKDRKPESVKYQILSKVIRLHSHNSKNNITDNFTKRITYPSTEQINNSEFYESQQNWCYAVASRIGFV